MGRGAGIANGGRILGVTGHRGRPLPGADLPLLEERVDRVLAGLAELGFQELISPLAEGADRLVAQRALVTGWTLRALLPFEALRYEEDFQGDGSVGEFRELLARAAGVEVVPDQAPEPGAASPDSDATPPDPAPPTGGPPGSAAAPDLPYRRVGRALLDRVGVLVAVWDGLPPRGPGGTGEVVQEAVRRGIPVVWIGSGAPHELRLLEPGVPGARVVGAGPAGALPSLLGRWLGKGAP
jgi:hypothetical protein